MRRRWVVVLAIVVVAISTVIGLRARESAARNGFVQTHHALDDGSAIVVWTDFGERDRATSVVRLASDGRILWRRSIHAYAVGFQITVGENTVVVRNFWEHCGWENVPCDRLFALALDSGRVLWTRDPTLRTGMPIRDDIRFARIVAGRYIDGLAVQPAEYDWTNSLFALDLRTGELAWETPVPRLVSAPLLLGDRLVLHELKGAVVIVDLETGTTTRGEFADEHGLGLGCAVDGNYFNITNRHTRPTLTAFAAGALDAPRALGPIPRLPRRPWFSTAASCAASGHNLVFVTNTSSNPAPGYTVVALIVRRDGQGARLVEIAEGGVVPDDVRSLSGAIPRYAPLHWRTSSEKRLVLLDLERATVVSRGALEHVELLDIFHAEERWYLDWDSSAPGYTVAVLDGHSGAVRAVDVDVDRLGGLEREHVAGGKIWVFDGGWGPRVPLDKIRVAVLDAATLAPIFVRGVRIADVTGIAREQLGLGAKP